jgi:hypothetical protein
MSDTTGLPTAIRSVVLVVAVGISFVTASCGSDEPEATRSTESADARHTGTTLATEQIVRETLARSFPEMSEEAQRALAARPPFDGATVTGLDYDQQAHAVIVEVQSESVDESNDPAQYDDQAFGLASFLAQQFWGPTTALVTLRGAEPGWLPRFRLVLDDAVSYECPPELMGDLAVETAGAAEFKSGCST